MATFNTLKDANKAYLKYQFLDPFQTISPALLNSVDIQKYCTEAGMIYPFQVSNLKPATYALTLGGDYIYWNSKKEKITGTLKFGKYLTLEKDSIVFLSLAETIQLPHYMAARFNLKISNIYKGLLLGTGPMVDPGFCGRLSIPVHNFTSNEYTIRGGDTFIWMEFTKISSHTQWSVPYKLNDSLKEFNLNFFNSSGAVRIVSDYLNEADSRAIQSSIPLSVGKSEAAAKSAANKVQTLTLVSAAINFGLVIGVLFFVWGVYQQIPNFQKANHESLEEIRKLHIQDSLERNILQDSIKILSLRVREKS